MREALRDLLRHRSAAAGLAMVLLALFIGLACSLIAPFNPVAQFRENTGQPPGTLVTAGAAAELRGGSPLWHASSFLMGTDVNGRDILSRVVYAARVSLLVGIVATLLNLLIGLLVGTLAGYYGGWLDSVLMRITDTFFAFPAYCWRSSSWQP